MAVFNEMPYLVIVSVVAVIAIVTLVLNEGGLQGAPIVVPDADPKAFCDNSNENLDPFQRGSVMEGRLLYEDTCDGKVLHQWSCIGGHGASQARPINCEFGCIRGACCKSAGECF